MTNISIIVTNWNAVKLLQKYFPQVVKTSEMAQEIIFADDASSDNSVGYITELQKTFPKIRIISQNTNLGFGKNSNDAVKKARGEFVVLLNSDIFPLPNYLKPALKYFNDPKILGVSFAETGHPNYAKLLWKNGYIQHSPETSSTVHISGWLSGGSSIIRRETFLKLGGFDSVYLPFYSEDLDLGYRAWKSGYKCLWEPQCQVDHHHESTISKFPKHTLDYVKERNRLLTVWRNITDTKMLAENRLALVGRVLSGPNYIKIILAAKRQIKNAKSPIVFPKLTDREIFKIFS
jgi:GT2 family glycosyltransferase